MPASRSTVKRPAAKRNAGAGPGKSPGARPGAASEGAIPPAFPLRVACVDVGSNAIRFAAAEFGARNRFTYLAQERLPVRLGHDVFLSGKLAPQAIDATVQALGLFRQRMTALGVTHYRAVATSATRESRNGDELIERARREAGIDLQVITGTEEGRLVHVAVSHAVPLGRERWILVDLGGGSVEVSLADASGPIWVESHNVGSVRLLEELSGAGDRPGAFRRLLEEYAHTLRIPSVARGKGPRGFIATGGNMEALAKLAGAGAGARAARDGVAVVPLAALRAVIETLSRLSYRQRVERLGLKEDRADVVLPAAMIIERLAVLTGARRILAPAVGLKEGVLLDLVDELTAAGGHDARHDKLVEAGARALGRHYFFDEPHAEHVTELCLSLFDQLHTRHGMGPAERRLLHAAALLHDIGGYISNKRHHKHTQYLIAQSELPGLTPREIQLCAAIARYHRKGDPAPQHEPFGRLPEADRTRVLRLAALLRISEALDREHRRRVRRVEARVSGTTLHLRLHGSGDLLLERWSLRRKAQLFQKAYGLKVRLSDETD